MKSAIAASGMLAATMGNVSYFIDLLSMIICSICPYHFICFYFRMYFTVGQNVCLPSGCRAERVPSIGQ